MSAKVSILSLAFLFAMPAGVQAQSGMPCFQRDTLVTALEEKYKESLTGGGIQNETQILEVWASAETGTFTVIITRADGISCIAATGKGWQQVEKVAALGVPG
jgi:hypothetical protein